MRISRTRQEMPTDSRWVLQQNLPGIYGWQSYVTSWFEQSTCGSECVVPCFQQNSNKLKCVTPGELIFLSLPLLFVSSFVNLLDWIENTNWNLQSWVNVGKCWQDFWRNLWSFALLTWGQTPILSFLVSGCKNCKKAKSQCWGLLANFVADFLCLFLCWCQGEGNKVMRVDTIQVKFKVLPGNRCTSQKHTFIHFSKAIRVDTIHVKCKVLPRLDCTNLIHFSPLYKGL